VSDCIGASQIGRKTPNHEESICWREIDPTTFGRSVGLRGQRINKGGRGFVLLVGPDQLCRSKNLTMDAERELSNRAGHCPVGGRVSKRGNTVTVKTIESLNNGFVRYVHDGISHMFPGSWGQNTPSSQLNGQISLQGNPQVREYSVHSLDVFSGNSSRIWDGFDSKERKAVDKSSQT
jgi:hypothetical protein